MKCFASIAVLFFLACHAPSPHEIDETSQALLKRDWSDAVIYLVLTDRFVNGTTSNDNLGAQDCFDRSSPYKFHGGDFQGLRSKIPYLQELGVNTVWITPAYRQMEKLPEGRCGYHGYWSEMTSPDDHAVEPKLGSPEDLEDLSAELQAHGMRLVLDMVVNHTGDLAALPKQKPEWFHTRSDCSQSSRKDEDCPLDDHPDFKQEHPEVAEYLSGRSEKWVGDFKLNGVRMDTAKHVPSDFFKSSWHPAVRRANPSLFTVAEVFNDQHASAFSKYFDAGFDSVFNFPLRRALHSSFLHGNSLDEIAQVIEQQVNTWGLERMLNVVNMINNHDVPRFVSSNATLNEAELEKRYLLALGALLTLPGIPQLYYGDELAMYGHRDPDNRRDMPGWAFSAATREVYHPNEATTSPGRVYRHVQQLLRLRKENLALQKGRYKELWRPNGATDQNVLAFVREHGDQKLMIVINNSSRPREVAIPTQGFESGTVFENLLESPFNRSVTVSNGIVPVRLIEKSMAIMKPRAEGTNFTQVEVKIRATTHYGETLMLVGNIPELGEWHLTRGVRMHPVSCVGRNCEYAVTLKYLPKGSSFIHRFVKVGRGTIWDAKGDSVFHVPKNPNARLDAGAF